MRRSSGAVLAALLLVVAVGPGPSAAFAGVEPISNPVLRDCVEHDGEITRSFSLQALRASRQSLAVEVKTYTFCPGAIRSAIDALSGPRGANTFRAVVEDCASDDGVLTHRYSLPTLRFAFHHLSKEVLQYTRCAKGIASQIHTLA